MNIHSVPRTSTPAVAAARRARPLRLAGASAPKRDAILRFAKGYREAVDWMYADPKALQMYSEKVKQPVEILAESLKEFHPKSAMQTDKMADLDAAVKDAVKLKFLDKPLSPDQVKEFLQIPPRG